MKKKKQPWLRLRHRIVTALLLWPFAIYTRLKYRADISRFDHQGRQFLVVMNHQTAWDQFFISLAFWRPVYYIASEDLFSKGWISRVLEWAVAPIPIKKQTTDLRAMRTCVQVAKEGGTIALAPEGNRTFSGRTCYFNPAIVKMVKMMKLPLAIFRIEGGYGVQPRWSDCVRRGKLRAYVKRVIEPEDYLSLPDAELHALLSQELYVDENCVDGEYHHKNAAEYMERMVYVCPECGLSEFESRGDTVTCKNCGLQVRYLPTKELQGVGRDFPFRFLGEWYDYQEQFVNGLELAPYADTPICRDRVKFSEVVVYKNKKVLCKDAELRLYGDRLEIGDGELPLYTLSFDATDMITVLGKNKLNIYCGDTLYQIKGGKPFNALKYMNIFFRWRNSREGAEESCFLGL